MKNILIIYGGNSYEHDISCMSAENVCKCLKNLNCTFDKIHISRENRWYVVKDKSEVEIFNIIDFIKKYDLIFPIMHGAYGEDGKIQSLFELFNINYLGSNSESSMIAMNKYLTKLAIKEINIEQVPYFIIKKNDKIPNNLEYPLIVKPVNGGSSIGISVAHSFKELKKAVENALKYDKDVIIEKFIDGIDLECGIVELNKLIVGNVGEINHSHEFYDFDAKYNCETKITIPAKVDRKTINKIKDISLRIFKHLNLQDFARIDFIYESSSKKIYFNEVNTIPGFTDKSMFPLLFKDKKLDFQKLISKLIENKKVK